VKPDIAAKIMHPLAHGIVVMSSFRIHNFRHNGWLCINMRIMREHPYMKKSKQLFFVLLKKTLSQ
jgi:hypothetical protein